MSNVYVRVFEVAVGIRCHLVSKAQFHRTSRRGDVTMLSRKGDLLFIHHPRHISLGITYQAVEDWHDKWIASNKPNRITLADRAALLQNNEIGMPVGEA